jgi:hypothetical protein
MVNVYGNKLSMNDRFLLSGGGAWYSEQKIVCLVEICSMEAPGVFYYYFHGRLKEAPGI